MIYNNSGIGNYKGMDLNGTTNNNTIYNNTFQLNVLTDYACNAFAGGINAQNNGINSGAKKIGCYWLALPVRSSALGCAAITMTTQISITNDYVYQTGATCYSVYANATIIDCGSHTILATHGGTFAMFQNSSGSTVQNCYLKGFSNPVQKINSQVNLVNDTFS
jgi:hypothetical protein